MSTVAYSLWPMDRGTGLTALIKQGLAKPSRQTIPTYEKRETDVGVCR